MEKPSAQLKAWKKLQKVFEPSNLFLKKMMSLELLSNHYRNYTNESIKTHFRQTMLDFYENIAGGDFYIKVINDVATVVPKQNQFTAKQQNMATQIAGQINKHLQIMDTLIDTCYSDDNDKVKGAHKAWLVVYLCWANAAMILSFCINLLGGDLVVPLVLATSLFPIAAFIVKMHVTRSEEVRIFQELLAQHNIIDNNRAPQQMPGLLGELLESASKNIELIKAGQEITNNAFNNLQNEAARTLVESQNPEKPAFLAKLIQEKVFGKTMISHSATTDPDAFIKNNIVPIVTKSIIEGNKNNETLVQIQLRAEQALDVALTQINSTSSAERALNILKTLAEKFNIDTSHTITPSGKEAQENTTQMRELFQRARTNLLTQINKSIVKHHNLNSQYALDQEEAEKELAQTIEQNFNSREMHAATAASLVTLSCVVIALSQIDLDALYAGGVNPMDVLSGALIATGSTALVFLVIFLMILTAPLLADVSVATWDTDKSFAENVGAIFSTLCTLATSDQPSLLKEMANITKELDPKLWEEIQEQAVMAEVQKEFKVLDV